MNMVFETLTFFLFKKTGEESLSEWNILENLLLPQRSFWISPTTTALIPPSSPHLLLPHYII